MDLFDLAAKITLDSSEYERGINSAGGKLSDFGNKLKTGIANAAKVTAAAVGVAATGVSALVKSSIDAYADYEQLVGGVETLFKGSADVVKSYAANAYKTAGLSANEYMETVTSFSASLLQSLGGNTLAAAQYADMAITDMADNANKMGTSMESIQNAYQGFAKQNYTMLDNLKLGYGGTKSEMERLILDAEKLNKNFKATRDKNGQLTMSYADIVDAIHIVQDNMGITGTTAKEASETISGSLNAMKSAWQNLVVGISDDKADFGTLVNNFVESASIAVKNVLPRITQSLSGVGKLVEGLAPVITQALPTLINDVLPGLLEASGTLISTFLSSMLESLPTVLSVAVQFVTTIFNGIIESAPLLIDAAIGIIGTLADGLIANLPGMFTAITDIILAIVDRLTQPDMIDKLIGGALGIILALATGIAQNLPRIVEAAKQIVRSLVEYFETHWDDIKAVGKQILDMVVEGIQATLSALWDLGAEVVDAIGAGISAAWDGLVGWFNGLWNNLFGGRNVDVNVNGHDNVEGSHAIGLDYVPFNGYVAELHRGEAVLTSREASDWRRGNSNQQQDTSPINIVTKVVLDDKVIGESVTKYQRNRARAFG